MDKENRSTVNFNILLNSSLRCLIRITSKSPIKNSESNSHAPETEKFNQWPVNIEKHCCYQSIPDVLEPETIEICYISSEEESKEPSLFFHVSINH